MKKSVFYFAALLLCAQMLSSCSSDDSDSYLPGPPVSKWSVVGEASLPSLDTRMAVSFSGYVRYLNWTSGDRISVYDADGNSLGSLVSTPLSYNPAMSEVSGYESLTGTFEAGQQLTYYYPSRSQDYTGQNGTVANVSANHLYVKAEPTVKEVDSDNHLVTMNHAAFSWNMGMAFFRFKDPDGNYLRPTKVVMNAESGRLVQTDDGNGNVTYGPLTVNTVETYDSYPNEIFVAFRTDKTDALDTYTFQVWVGDKYYCSSTSLPASVYTPSKPYAPGKFYSKDITLTAGSLELGNSITNWNANEENGSTTSIVTGDGDVSNGTSTINAWGDGGTTDDTTVTIYE